MQGAKTMQNLIDKLCDHLPTDRIKLFIESGFDEWQTVTFMKGEELPQLGFNAEECIVIMVAINSQAKEINQQEIFSESTMQQVLGQAKEADKIRHEKIMQEEIEQKMNKANLTEQSQEKQEEIVKHEDVKQFPQKPISEAILLKGVTLKGKQKVPLNKITLMSLQQKEITHICELQRVPHLQNLHLNRNHIYTIQNLDILTKLRVLKLQSNEIVKMQGLNNLQSLEQLFIGDNHISHLEGLTNNKRLHILNISHQKSKYSMTFDEETCMALGYCLQVFVCDHNRVRDITNFQYFKVLHNLSLRTNQLGDMEVLSEPFGGMERLKTMDLRNNPLSTMPKYRDYVVILCKSLEQLDNKKILPKEREYLVKLYSLKHAKQIRQENKQSKPPSSKQIDLHVTKLEEGAGMYSHGGDLRGNAPYANTKIHKH